MAFGEEHRIAAPPLQSTADGVVDQGIASQNTVDFQKMLDDAHSAGGGYIYFPPGRYLLGRRRRGHAERPLEDPAASVEGGDIVVYEDITLCFAPGAVLVPLGRGRVNVRDVGDPDEEDQLVRVEIHGEIQAPRSEIFAISTSHGNEDDAGLILLAGSRVREVYPEWWGAVSLAGVDGAIRNCRAIQAAFDAAHRHRLRPLRDEAGAVQFASGAPRLRRMPAIPVVLSGSYTLIGEVSFGVPRTELGAPPRPLHPVNTAGFVLRGEHGVGSVGVGRANFFASVQWSSTAGDAFLAIRGPSGFTVKNVSFNGGLLAIRCLDIVNPVAGGAGVFDGCSFINARSALVRIDGEAVSVGMRSPTLLAFRHCRLETAYANQTRSSGITHTRGEDLVCVRLDGRDSVIAEFQTCTLTGPANPLIAAHSGWFGLHDCVLHSTRLYDPRGVAIINAERNTVNGTDIHLAAPTHVRSDGLLEGASFVSQQIETQSWQFMATYAAPAEDVRARTARDACVLINYNMNNVSGPIGGDTDFEEQRQASIDQPSVVWDGPGKSGIDLVLMGIIVKARTGVTAEHRNRDTRGGYIHLSASLTGRVFDLGVISPRDTAPGSTQPFGSDPGFPTVRLLRAPNAT